MAEEEVSKKKRDKPIPITELSPVGAEHYVDVDSLMAIDPELAARYKQHEEFATQLRAMRAGVPVPTVTYFSEPRPEQVRRRQSP